MGCPFRHSWAEREFSESTKIGQGKKNKVIGWSYGKKCARLNLLSYQRLYLFDTVFFIMTSTCYHVCAQIYMLKDK